MLSKEQNVRLSVPESQQRGHARFLDHGLGPAEQDDRVLRRRRQVLRDELLRHKARVEGRAY